MFKRNIIITEFNLLYQILFEINDYLKCNLKKSNLNDIDKIDISDSIILSKFTYKNQLISKKKINLNNTIFFSDNDELAKIINDAECISMPFNIDNFIEKINIKFLKGKFNDQSFIKILNYTLDVNSRIISKDGINLKLTEKEVDIIIYLTETKKPQKVNILQNQVWGYVSELETHTVETHIYRLRKKIFDKFKDKKFILSKNEGYLIK